MDDIIISSNGAIENVELMKLSKKKFIAQVLIVSKSLLVGAFKI